MSEETKKKVRKIARVALRPETEQILNQWRLELRTAFPTFSPSSSDLVAWAVERIPTLSKKHVQEIRALFFDEVKELESLVAQLKKVKASGDEDQLRTLLHEIKGKRTSQSRAASKLKNTSENIENTAT